jgi:hypothetical protein
MTYHARKFVRQCFNLDLSVTQAWEDANAAGYRLTFRQVEACYRSFVLTLDALHA